MYILTENQFDELLKIRDNFIFGSPYNDKFNFLLTEIEKQKIEIKKEELM